MNVEKITLIIAITGLIVAEATLIVAIMTYRYYMNSDKRNVRKKLRKIEERYERLNGITQISPFSPMAGMVKNKHFEERDKLEKEIEELKDRL